MLHIDRRNGLYMVLFIVNCERNLDDFGIFCVIINIGIFIINCQLHNGPLLLEFGSILIALKIVSKTEYRNSITFSFP